MHTMYLGSGEVKIANWEEVCPEVGNLIRPLEGGDLPDYLAYQITAIGEKYFLGRVVGAPDYYPEQMLSKHKCVYIFRKSVKQIQT